MAEAGRRIAVVGCGRGGLALALAVAEPAAVIAGFDPDPRAVAAARRAAATLGVADRTTFEVASAGCLLGGGYDVVYLIPATGWEAAGVAAVLACGTPPWTAGSAGEIAAAGPATPAAPPTGR